MSLKRFMVLVSLCTCLVASFAADNTIRIFSEKKEGGGYDLYADNAALIPYQLKLEFPLLENLAPSVEVPAFFSLSPQSAQNYLLSLVPPAKGKYSYRYNYNYYKGDPWTVEHNDAYLYLFPYAHGTKHRIVQGYNGATTHQGDGRYALDFNLDTGTPVYAAREGLVIFVKEDSNTGGVGAEFAEYGNYVEIYHADGSYADYFHLEQNGAAVTPGQEVKAGELIGYSGNTGRSSGPHLHFAVYIPLVGGNTTIPVRFLGTDGQAVAAEEGLVYYASHPDKPVGKPAFEIKLGRNITNEMYADYSAAVPATDKIEFRTETVDTVVVFFVKNGFKVKKKLTVDFTLVNMAPSKALPYTVELLPGTESFLLFLAAPDYGARWSYKYTYNFK